MVNSIAVFPFEMIKGSEKWNFLKEQFSESLTFQLGGMKNIKIIDRLQIRKSLQQYDEPKQAGLADLATEIGKDIGANLVLLGNFTIIEKEILIITKIVNSKTGQITPLVKNKYSDMMNDNPNGTLAAEMGVNPNDAPDFLTKDYRKVMKAIDEKKAK